MTAIQQYSNTAIQQYSNTAPDHPMTQSTTPSPATTATATGDSAETALDWAGEYKGVSPVLTAKVLKPNWN
jgi:hypothetical protein